MRSDCGGEREDSCVARTSLSSGEGILAATGGAEVKLLAGRRLLLLHVCVVVIFQVSQGYDVRVIAGGQKRDVPFPLSTVSGLQGICWRGLAQRAVTQWLWIIYKNTLWIIFRSSHLRDAQCLIYGSFSQCVVEGISTSFFNTPS